MMRPFLFLLFAAAAAVAPAGPMRFASGARQVALIELYTSEGCSSCPPAERWLAGLHDDAGLWRDFVPMAFHVSYWDNLGWPDRFASRGFTARQYALAAAWGSGSVYTPCFVRNGSEWHPSGDAPPAGGDTAAGVLAVTLNPDSGGCRVEFSPAGKASADYEAHVALLGGGLVSNVTAGENEGETLRHEFVVLALADARMKTGGASAVAEMKLPESKTGGGERRAVAVWITRRGTLVPVQATGGWLR